MRVEERNEYPVQHPAKVEDLLKLPLAAKGDEVVRWRNAARLNDISMLRQMIEVRPSVQYGHTRDRPTPCHS